MLFILLLALRPVKVVILEASIVCEAMLVDRLPRVCACGESGLGVGGNMEESELWRGMRVWGSLKG